MYATCKLLFGLWFDEFEIQCCLSDNSSKDITKVTGAGKEKSNHHCRDVLPNSPNFHKRNERHLDRRADMFSLSYLGARRFVATD